MTESLELAAEQLRFQCDESIFSFDTTESVPPLEVMIGQERAVKAVEFGLFTKIPGYNIFISGLVGTGKITYAKSAVHKVAQDEAVPDDWCYVNNFENPSQPIAVSLPAGQGGNFRQDMQDLVENLKTDIPKIFSGDHYEEAKGEIVKTFQAKRAVIMEGFNQYCEQYGISPQWSTTGFVGLPVQNGTPVTPEEFQKLDKDKRAYWFHSRRRSLLDSNQLCFGIAFLNFINFHFRCFTGQSLRNKNSEVPVTADTFSTMTEVDDFHCIPAAHSYRRYLIFRHVTHLICAKFVPLAQSFNLLQGVY